MLFQFSLTCFLILNLVSVTRLQLFPFKCFFFWIFNFFYSELCVLFQFSLCFYFKLTHFHYFSHCWFFFLVYKFSTLFLRNFSLRVTRLLYKRKIIIKKIIYIYIVYTQPTVGLPVIIYIFVLISLTEFHIGNNNPIYLSYFLQSNLYLFFSLFHSFFFSFIYFSSPSVKVEHRKVYKAKE